MAAGTTEATVAPESRPRFETGTILALGIAHCVHDIYPSFLGVLLPTLIARFGLSLTVAGLLASVLNLTSVTQPLMGYVIDRADPRRWIVIATAATAVLMSLLGIAPSVLVAFLLLLGAGLTVAAFHPAAGALVTQIAAGQWGKATSLFMTGGAAGAAIGPLFIAAVVSGVGIDRVWLAAIPGLVYAAILFWGLRRSAGRIVRQPPGPIGAALRRQWRPIAILALAVTFQATGVVGFVTFYPTYVVRSGQSLVDAGIAITLFQVGGAIGSLSGGWLSDRVGRRSILMISPLLGVPTLLAAVVIGVSPVQFPLLVLGGAFMMSAGPVQLVFIQELLPENRSTAAGMMFFLTIGAASLSTIAVGAAGDLIGLERAVLAGIATGILALPFVWLLPRRRAAARTVAA